MPDDKNPGHDRTDRRTFLKWASTVGLTAIAPTTVSEVAEGKARREKPDPIPASRRGDRADEVYLPHVTELEHFQEQLSAFDRTGDPEVLYEAQLQRELRDGSRESYDLVVRTLGERVKNVTNRYERTIRGWKPTDEELDALRQFGDLGFVPEFMATTVSLKGVAADAIEELAALPFVVSVDADVTEGGDGTHPTISEIRSTDYSWFESVEDDYYISTSVRCGIIDRGYAGGGYSDYSESKAEWQIDTSLAHDFTEEGYGWDVPANNHGDNVTDTVAYTLNEGHSNLYVPLKISWEEYDDDWTDNIRSAIEYAADNDIEVINISQQTGNTYSSCPSTFCDLLYNYSAAGYVCIAISGNHGEETEAAEPGLSLLDVGVGGIDGGSCSDDNDYPRHTSSNYGEIYYGNCGWCKAITSDYFHHCPDVYGVYRFKTDAGTTISGTSYAAPQATASAVIMQSNGVYDYHEIRDVFRGMGYYTICPDESAKLGELNDGWDAYYRTN